MPLPIPGELKPLLDALGARWPAADEDKLFDLATAWQELPAKLDTIADRADAAAGSVWAGNEGEGVAAFKASWTAPDSPVAALRSGAAGTALVAPAILVAGAVVIALKITMVAQLTGLMLQLDQANALAPATFGASLNASGADRQATARLIDAAQEMALRTIQA